MCPDSNYLCNLLGGTAVLEVDSLFSDRLTHDSQLISWGEFFMDYSLMAPFYAILVSIPMLGSSYGVHPQTSPIK